MKAFKTILLGLTASGFLLTGCLGGTEDDIVGTWRLVPVDQTVVPFELTFGEDKTVIFKDLQHGISDTGTYHLAADFDHRYVDIKGLGDAWKWYKSNIPSLPGKPHPLSKTMYIQSKHVITKLNATALILTTNMKSPDSDRAIDQYDFVRVTP